LSIIIKNNGKYGYINRQRKFNFARRDKQS